MKNYVFQITLALLLSVAVGGVAANAEDSPEGIEASGFPIPKFIEVSPGIFRGGRPGDRGLEYLAQLGVRDIVNLENDREAVRQEIESAAILGIREHLSPMNSWATPRDGEINGVLEILRDEDIRPIFIHCQHGEDRTGLVMGLHRVLNEAWRAKPAYGEMKTLGFHSIFWNMKEYFERRTHWED